MIARVSEYDEQNDTYLLSAYLIAQLGKNYTDEANLKITGKELLELAIRKIKESQYLTGGTVMFLEAENNEKLMNFYKNENKFRQFDIRKSANNNHTYNQLLRII